MHTSDALDELVHRAYAIGRTESDERALRWLRTIVSILGDWGGSDAKAALKEALPSELFSGAGSSGRSFRAAAEAGGTTDEEAALLVEAGRRVKQPDPGKVGMTIRPLMGLLKERLSATQVDRVAAHLPPAVQRQFRAATTQAPFPYRLIPQSYARPDAPSHSTSHSYAHDHSKH
jgi:uncharacterized protein (DUF2267 family)